MTRPIWKGYITFGLVNVPVILYSAEKKSDIHLKLVDSRDKAKIHYVRINEQTGEEVPWNEVAKGFEYSDDNYVVLKESDIKAISDEHSKTIEISGFIEKENLNSMDFEKPYYLVPDKKGEKGYVILREILKSTKKIGICKVIIHTRGYLAALIPHEDALVLNLLRYEEEIKKPSEFEFPSANLTTYKISPREIDIAKQLVASMTIKWHPEEYQDNFRQTLKKWIKEKIRHEGKKISRKKQEPVVATKTNVINFIDLLKKSLEKNKKVESHHKKKARSK